jgi:hypothetical protein
MSLANTIWTLPDAWERAELLGALREVIVEGGVEPLKRPPIDFLLAKGTGKARVQSLVRAALDQIGFEEVAVGLDCTTKSPEAGSDLELEVAACMAATSFWRSRHGIPFADPVLEAQMCVVTAVYLGFGTFLANGAYFVRIGKQEQREQVSTGPLPPAHVCFLLAVRCVVGRTPHDRRGEGLWIRECLNAVQRSFYLKLTADLRDEAPRLCEILGIPRPAERSP